MATAPPGCYLLLVLGQPCAKEHKEHILRKVEEGLLSWDVEETRCDLLGLESVCSSLQASSEVENELLIQHSTENLAVEVLLNPHVNTLKQCLKNLLAANVGHKHVIHAGYAFSDSGSWVLQDGSFSHYDFVDTLQDVDVQRALRRHLGCTVHVHCIPEGPWAQQGEDKGALSKMYESLYVNPASKVSVVPGSSLLLNCLDSVLRFQPLTEMMKSSPVVGNIRFNRPTLYVFPGGQGDCALFGVSGFTMLIDGGFNRKPCFWEFIRHLDRLDAIMITRLNENNVCGITNVVRRKQAGKRVYPQVGYVFCNVAEGKQSPTSPGSAGQEKDPLLVSVIQEGREFSENLQQLGLKPHRCLRDCQVEPLTLFHKVGHGTLEMYVLSPPKDSKEMKMFFQQWTSYKEHFSSKRYVDDREVPIPLSHAMSICALLVWKPADPADTITRVLLPGSAPQSKIFEGLEHLRHLEELRYRTCSQMSLGIKYEERVKIKTTRKHVAKSSIAKQKAEITRASSPMKSVKDMDDQMRLQRKRAESPVKLLTSSPVRRIKKSIKKGEDKKLTESKEDVSVKKSTKTVFKKVKKRSRSKSKEQVAEIEKDDNKSVEEDTKTLEADDVIEIEVEPIPASEVDKVDEEQDQTEEGKDEEGKDKDVEDKSEEIEELEVEDKSELIEGKDKEIDSAIPEEEKLLLETEEREKVSTPEDEHSSLDEMKKGELEENKLESEEKDEDKDSLKSERIKTDDKDEECPDSEIKTQQEEEKVDEPEEIQTKIPAPEISKDVSSEQLNIEEEVKSQPGDEDTGLPPKDQKKDIESKPKSKGAVKKSKIISRTTSSSKSIAASSKSTPSPPKLLRLRKETDQKSIVKKDVTLDRENKVKTVAVKSTKTKLKAAINVQVPADGPTKTPTPPSKLTIKAKELKQSSAIKEVKSLKTAKMPLKAESKLVKLEAKTEVKSKIAKDVVNKRVAESKNLAKQLELAKAKPPATLPKSPTKKPKVNLPLMSPKKKVKAPLAVSATKTSKLSKDKTKPKPVKRPEKTKEVIPSAPEDATPEEKGPPTPPEEIIPSPVPSPSEKSVEEEMVQDVPSSPKEVQSSAVDIAEETAEKTPSETQEPTSPQEVEVEEKSPTVTEPKDTEAPEKEEAISDQIFDEQMVVKEIEAVEAAMDELIEGIEESKAKSVARDAQQSSSQQKDIDAQEQVDIADLVEDRSTESGVSLGEVESVEEYVISPEQLKTIQTDPTWSKLQETLEPAIQHEISSITQSIKKEGVNLDNYKITIYEIVYEILIINKMPLTVEYVTKYIKESEKEITNAICKKYQAVTDIKESEAEEIVETSPPEEEMTTEVTSEHKIEKVIDKSQFKEISVKEPSEKIPEKKTSPGVKDISSEGEEENAATDESEIESIEEHIQSTKVTEQPIKEALELKVTKTAEETAEGDLEEEKPMKDAAEKQVLESPELKTGADVSPGPKEVDSELTDKGEIKGASEEETTTKAIIEDVSSPVQETALSKPEEDKTAETEQTEVSDVSEMKQPETVSLDEEESITTNWLKLRESLEPAVQLEISFIKENIKNAGVILDNYEIIIYDVILEILQVQNISLTEECVTKYVTENKVEIAKTICEKHQPADEQGETEDISDKNKQEALEQISPTAQADENELDDSKKEAISKVIEKESTTAEVEEKESTKAEDEEEKESDVAGDEEKEMLPEIEKSEKIEKVTKVEEPVAESEEGESSTEAVVGSKEEPLSNDDEKYKYIEDQLVEAVWSHEEEHAQVDIMECITPEIKNIINDLAKEIQVESVMVENLVEIIFQTLEEELRSKQISIGSSEIIQYILKYRTEIICIVQRKLSAQESVGDDREPASEDKETIEETITISNLKNYLTSEACDIISVIKEELKIDGMAESECEEMILQTICEEIQNQNTPLETTAISQYIIKYRIHILTIIKTKIHYTEGGAVEKENVLLPIKTTTATEIISETKISQASEDQKLDSGRISASTTETVDESDIGRKTEVDSETITIKTPDDQLKEEPRSDLTIEEVITSKSDSEIIEKSQAEQAEERATKLDISDKIEDALSEKIKSPASPEEMDIKSPSIKGDEVEFENTISSEQQDFKTPSDEIKDKSEEKEIISESEIGQNEEIEVSTELELELTPEKTETIIEKTTTPKTPSEMDKSETTPVEETADTTSKLAELQKESDVETTGAEEPVSKLTTDDAELKPTTLKLDGMAAEEVTTPKSPTLKEIDSPSDKPDDKIVEKVVTPKSPTEKIETKSPSETVNDVTEEISVSPTSQKVESIEKTTDEILKKAITPQSPIDSQEVKSTVDESDIAVGKDATYKSPIEGEAEPSIDATVEKSASPSPTKEQIEIISSVSKAEDAEEESEILPKSPTQSAIEILSDKQKDAISEKGSPQETPTEQIKDKSPVGEVEAKEETTSISPTEQQETQSSIDKIEGVDEETEVVTEPISQEAIHSSKIIDEAIIEKEVILESDSKKIGVTDQAEEVEDANEEETVPKILKEKVGSPEKSDERIITPKTPTELKEVTSLTSKTEEETLEKDVSLKSPTQLKTDEVLEETEITPKSKTETGLAPEDKEDQAKLEQVTTPTATDMEETETHMDLKKDAEDETEDISKLSDEIQVKSPDTIEGTIIKKGVSSPSLPVEEEVQSPKEEKETVEKIEISSKLPIEEKVESSDKAADESVIPPKTPTESSIDIADASEEKRTVLQPASELEPEPEKEDDIEKVTTPTKQLEDKSTSDEAEIVSEEKERTITSPTQLKIASSDQKSDVITEEVATSKSPSGDTMLKSPDDKIEDKTQEKEITSISPSEKEVKSPEKPGDTIVEKIMSPKTPTDQQEVKSIVEQADSAVEEVIDSKTSTEVEHAPSIEKVDTTISAEQEKLEIEPSTNVIEMKEEHLTQLETEPSDKIVDEVSEKIIVSESPSEEPIPPSDRSKDVAEKYTASISPVAEKDTAPISPVAEKDTAPKSPIAEKDTASISPVAEKDMAPISPIAEKDTAPKSPIAEKVAASISPVAEKDTAPKSPVAEKDTAPKSPIAEKVAASKSPVAEKDMAPISPVAEKDTAPKSPIEEKVAASISPISEKDTAQISPIAEKDTTPKSPIAETDKAPKSPIVEKHDTHETVIEELSEHVITQESSTEEKKIQSPVDSPKYEAEIDISLELEKVTDKTDDVTVEKIATPKTPIDQKEIPKEEMDKSPTQMKIELSTGKEDSASVEKTSTPESPSDQKEDKSPVDKIKSAEAEEKITTKSPTEERAEPSDQITEAITKRTSTPQTPTESEKDSVATETEEVVLKSPTDIKVKSLPIKIDIPVDEKLTILTDQEQAKTPIHEVGDVAVEKEITPISPTLRKVESPTDETVEEITLSKTPTEIKEVTSSIDKIETIPVTEKITPTTPTKLEIDESSVKDKDLLDEDAAVEKEITPESTTELKLESSVDEEVVEKVLSPKSSPEEEKMDSIVTKEQEITAKSPSEEKSTSEKDAEKSITPTTTEATEVISAIVKTDEGIDDTQISSELADESSANETDEGKVEKTITSSKTVEQGELKLSIDETEDAAEGEKTTPESLTQLKIESPEEGDTELEHVISQKTPLDEEEDKSPTDVKDTEKEKEAILKSPTELKTETSDKSDELTVLPTTPSEKKEASPTSETVTHSEDDKVSIESPTQQKTDSPDKKDVAVTEVTITKISIHNVEKESLGDEVDEVTEEKEDISKSAVQVESTDETGAVIDTKPISPILTGEETAQPQIEKDDVLESEAIPVSPAKLELDAASSKKDDLICQKIISPIKPTEQKSPSPVEEIKSHEEKKEDALKHSQELVGESATEDADDTKEEKTVDPISTSDQKEVQTPIDEIQDESLEKIDEPIVRKAIATETFTEQKEDESHIDEIEDKEAAKKSSTEPKVDSTVDKTGDAVEEDLITSTISIEEKEAISFTEVSEEKEITMKSPSQQQVESPSDKIDVVPVEETIKSPTKGEEAKSPIDKRDVSADEEVITKSPSEQQVDLHSDKMSDESLEREVTTKSPVEVISTVKTEDSITKTLTSVVIKEEKSPTDKTGTAKEIISKSPTEQQSELSSDVTGVTTIEEDITSKPVTKQLKDKSPSKEMEGVVEEKEITSTLSNEQTAEGSIDKIDKAVEKVTTPKSPEQTKEESNFEGVTEEKVTSPKTPSEQKDDESPIEKMKDEVAEKESPSAFSTELEFESQPKTQIQSKKGKSPDGKDVADQSPSELTVESPTGKIEVPEVEGKIISSKTTTEQKEDESSMDETKIVAEKEIISKSATEIVTEASSDIKSEVEVTSTTTTEMEAVEATDTIGDAKSDIIITAQSPSELKVKSPGDQINEIKIEKEILSKSDSEKVVDESSNEKLEDKSPEKDVTTPSPSELKVESPEKVSTIIQQDKPLESKIEREEKETSISSSIELEIKSPSDKADSESEKVQTPTEKTVVKSPIDQIKETTSDEIVDTISAIDSEVKSTLSSTSEKEIKMESTTAEDTVDGKETTRKVPTDLEIEAVYIEACESLTKEGTSSRTPTDKKEAISPGDKIEEASNEEVITSKSPPSLEISPKEKKDEALEKAVSSKTPTEEPKSSKHTPDQEDKSPSVKSDDIKSEKSPVLETPTDKDITTPVGEIEDTSSDKVIDSVTHTELKIISPSVDKTGEKEDTTDTQSEEVEASTIDTEDDVEQKEIFAKSSTELKIESPGDKTSDETTEKAVTPKTPIEQTEEKISKDDLDDVPSSKELSSKSPTSVEVESPIDQTTEKLTSSTEKQESKSPIDKIDVAEKEMSITSTGEKIKLPTGIKDDTIFEKITTQTFTQHTVIKSVDDKTKKEESKETGISEESDIGETAELILEKAISPKSPTEKQVKTPEDKQKILETEKPITKPKSVRALADKMEKSFTESERVSPVKDASDDKTPIEEGSETKSVFQKIKFFESSAQKLKTPSPSEESIKQKLITKKLTSPISPIEKHEKKSPTDKMDATEKELSTASSEQRMKSPTAKKDDIASIRVTPQTIAETHEKDDKLSPHEDIKETVNELELTSKSSYQSSIENLETKESKIEIIDKQSAEITSEDEKEQDVIERETPSPVDDSESEKSLSEEKEILPPAEFIEHVQSVQKSESSFETEKIVSQGVKISTIKSVHETSPESKDTKELEDDLKSTSLETDVTKQKSASMDKEEFKSPDREKEQLTQEMQTLKSTETDVSTTPMPKKEVEEKSPSETKEITTSKSEADFELQKSEKESDAFRSECCTEIRKQIKNIESLFSEFKGEFSIEDFVKILYETVIYELRRKKITITVETIIKYIIEYRTEIIRIIQIKYFKGGSASTVHTEEHTDKHSSGSFKQETTIVKTLDSSDVYAESYDDDGISPIAESVMGEDMEIQDEDLEDDVQMIAEVATYKTVYEKPEAEQVFRHIFAESVVEEEVEILQGPGSAVGETLDVSSKEKESEDSDILKKKLMYIEIEVEESVTASTDASPDTDAPEIPYDGRYKEHVAESESTEVTSKECVSDEEFKEEIAIKTSEISIESEETKEPDEKVEIIEHASLITSEEASEKKQLKKVETIEKESKEKMHEGKTSESEIAKLVEEDPQALETAKEQQHEFPDETVSTEEKPDDETHTKSDEIISEPKSSKQGIDSEITRTEIKTETSYVVHASQTPTTSEISKVLSESSVVEGESGVSETSIKVISSKTTSTDQGKDCFTTITKTETDEDAFETITKVTTTELITSKIDELVELKSPVSEKKISPAEEHVSTSTIDSEYKSLPDESLPTDLEKSSQDDNIEKTETIRESEIIKSDVLTTTETSESEKQSDSAQVSLQHSTKSKILLEEETGLKESIEGDRIELDEMATVEHTQLTADESEMRTAEAVTKLEILSTHQSLIVEGDHETEMKVDEIKACESDKEIDISRESVEAPEAFEETITEIQPTDIQTSEVLSSQLSPSDSSWHSETITTTSVGEDGSITTTTTTVSTRTIEHADQDKELQEAGIEDIHKSDKESLPKVSSETEDETLDTAQASQSEVEKTCKSISKVSKTEDGSTSLETASITTTEKVMSKQDPAMSDTETADDTFCTKSETQSSGNAVSSIDTTIKKESLHDEKTSFSSTESSTKDSKTDSETTSVTTIKHIDAKPDTITKTIIKETSTKVMQSSKDSDDVSTSITKTSSNEEEYTDSVESDSNQQKFSNDTECIESELEPVAVSSTESTKDISEHKISSSENVEPEVDTSISKLESTTHESADDKDFTVEDATENIIDEIVEVPSKEFSTKDSKTDTEDSSLITTKQAVEEKDDFTKTCFIKESSKKELQSSIDPEDATITMSETAGECVDSIQAGKSSSSKLSKDECIESECESVSVTSTDTRKEMSAHQISSSETVDTAIGTSFSESESIAYKTSGDKDVTADDTILKESISDEKDKLTPTKFLTKDSITDTEDSSVTVLKQVLDEGPDAITKTIIKESSTKVMQSSKDAGDATIEKISVTTDTKDSSVTVLKQVVDEGADAITKTIIKESSTKVMQSSKDPGGATIEESSVTTDTEDSSVTAMKQVIDEEPDAITKTIIKESSTKVMQSSKDPGGATIEESSVTTDTEDSSVTAKKQVINEEPDAITKTIIKESSTKVMQSSKDPCGATIEESSVTTDTKDSSVTVLKQVIDEEPDAITKTIIKESSKEVMQSSKDPGGATIEESSVTTDTKDSSVTVLKQVISEGPDAITKTIIKESSTKVLKSSKDPGGVTIDESSVTTDTEDSSVTAMKQVIDEEPDAITKTIIKESSTEVMQSSKDPGGATIEESSVTTDTKDSSVTVLKQVISEGPDATTKTIIKESSTKVLKSSKDPGGVTIDESSVTTDTEDSSVTAMKQVIDEEQDAITKTIIKESSTKITQSSKDPGGATITITKTVVHEGDDSIESEKTSASKFSKEEECFESKMESVSVTSTDSLKDKKITKKEISEHISSSEGLNASFSKTESSTRKFSCDELSKDVDSKESEPDEEIKSSASTEFSTKDSSADLVVSSETTVKEETDGKQHVTTKTIIKESSTKVMQSLTDPGALDVTSTIRQTEVHEECPESIDSAKSSLSKISTEPEYEFQSLSKTSTDSIKDKKEYTKKDISEQHTSSEKEEFDKTSEKQFEESTVITKAFMKEEEKSAGSKMSQSVKTTEEVTTEKSRLEGSNLSGGDYTTTTITKTSLSETRESEDVQKETSEDRTFKTVKTSEIISESPTERIEEDIAKTKLDSEEESVTESSSRRRRRIVKKKVFIYHTGSETVPEDILTDDKIREAILKAGGTHASASHARIISSGVTEDLDSFTGQDNAIEIIESKTSEQTKENIVTESTSKRETTEEELQHVEFDPFSLITKPIEEVFRRKMMEQTLSEQSTETKQVKSKEETTFSKEKRRESIEEKDTDTIQTDSIDRKVATDAKKLAMETTRTTQERSETHESTQSETSEIHEMTSSTSSTTERSSTRDQQPAAESNQSERSGSTEAKSFSLDEWDKPMGLPSPPEPLDFETDLASLTKQNTTRPTKQEGDYKENKSDSPGSGRSNIAEMKSDTEKSNKETDSLPEKECNYESNNKASESSSDPVYIDLTYVPHFGDPHYCNVEFFRRIRSRYYVFSGTKPSKEVFNALLEAKQDWKDKEAKVTIIPTYETDTLGYWMAVNQDALIANNIDVAPSASRCTINLQDHETSCSAYRLEL